MAKSMKGKFDRTLDPKGRMIVPAQLRDALGTDFVVTVGLDKCLYLYSTEGWEDFTEKLRGLGTGKKANRSVVRFFTEHAADLSMDSQGRSLIPAELRDFVNIKKDIVIIGSLDRAEVWAREEYEEMHKQPEATREYIEDVFENEDFDF